MMILDGHEALGTRWWVEILQNPYKITEENRIRTRIIDILWDFERMYSRFIPNSLVCILNANRSLYNAPSALIKIITEATTLRFETDGLYSIHIGKQLTSYGYGTLHTHTSNKQTIVMQDTIYIHNDTIFLEGDEDIDLGSLGKGFCIGLIGRELESMGYHHYIINGGGDIYATSTEQDAPITVYIENPYNRADVATEVLLYKQSVCCSSPLVRTWKYGGNVYTHLVVPAGAHTTPLHIYPTMVVGEDPCITDALATAYSFISEDMCHTLAKKYHVLWERWQPVAISNYFNRTSKHSHTT